MGILAYKVAKIIKSLVFKPQCLITWANDMFLWPRSTVISRERVTPIETIVQNLYRLTNFYRLIVSTDISPTPNPEHIYFKLHPFVLLLCSSLFHLSWHCNVFNVEEAWMKSNSSICGHLCVLFVSMVIFLPVDVTCEIEVFRFFWLFSSCFSK